MRVNSARRWVRCQRDRLKWPVERVARLIRIGGGAERVNRPASAFALPGLRSWLLVASLLIDIAWLGACWVVATQYHATLAVILASLPVLKWSLMLVCRHSGQDNRLAKPASWDEPARSTFFGPASPEGAGLAPECPRSRYQDLRDIDISRDRASGLVRDRLSGMGLEYRVVSGWLPPRRTANPFGTVPDWWKVYQIAVEDPHGLVDYGWVHLGDGKVDIMFETEGHSRTHATAPAQAPDRPQEHFPTEAMRVLASPEPVVQPMI